MTLPATKLTLSEADGLSAIPDGAGATAEGLAHFSAQPVSWAQSPFACLSQSFIFGQQSVCAATKTASGEGTWAFATVAGGMASARAMKTTRMDRARLIASNTYPPLFLSGQVTEV